MAVSWARPQISSSSLRPQRLLENASRTDPSAHQREFVSWQRGDGKRRVQSHTMTETYLISLLVLCCLLDPHDFLFFLHGAPRGLHGFLGLWAVVLKHTIHAFNNTINASY